ncbi:MAG: CocE/NonD family hydrolase C-terminal non-catalytic domain-containing protein, partial [Blastococcus sp.]
RDWTRYAGHGADDEQYGAARRFPLRGSVAYRISGSDRLVLPGHPVTSGSVTMLNPPGGEPAAYSETSNFTGPDSSPRSGDVPPQEVDGQFAAFTSAPFRHAFRSVGIPAAHLLMANSNGQDMVFFAKVYDVAPDGSTELIHRLIAPVRVPAAAVGAPVDLRLAGFAHRFAAGHAVRLVLCTTDQTSYNAKVADVLTLSTGAGSTFTLPGRLR